MLKNFENTLDEEDKQYKKQEKEYKQQYNVNQLKPQKMDYGGFKTPKLDIPRMNFSK